MTYPNTTLSQVQDIFLEKLKFKISQELERMDLRFGFNLDSYINTISNNFVYNLKVNIFGEKHRVEICVPSTWFQMFKKEYFPKWLLNKFPIKNTTLGTLELYQLYPHIKASIPEERHYIHFTKFELPK